MNVKDYIESGVVELYAMNTLSPEEKKEFERLGMLYPEIPEELRKVEESLRAYTFSHAVNPRPLLRERIVLREEGKPSNKNKETFSQEESYSLTYKYLIAASLAALVISTFASWFFYSRWTEAEDRYSSLLKEKNDLAINFNVIKAAYDEMLTNMLILRDELSTATTLYSLDTSQHYQARVYWNQGNGLTYTDVLSLPVAPEGMTYRLWALSKGVAFDAGKLLPGKSGIQRMHDVAMADNWKVTLESREDTIPSPTGLLVLSSEKKP